MDEKIWEGIRKNKGRKIIAADFNYTMSTKLGKRCSRNDSRTK